ncbi:hypothetical protein FPI77_06395 [Klebsiella quasivariicola]|nr:hypothetical protein [Klebsiella quasivariicola]NBZ73466.1 hypothetical protein [Klebsiella quasivariicola]QBL50343.1 hypothetical protein BMD99_018375 [Klebsiella sp. PO552]TTN51074.1 hypothetical protein FPI77_06395 [Klebsiella quasivariicola]
MQYKRFTHRSEPEERFSGRCLILPPGPFFANKLYWIFNQYLLMIAPEAGFLAGKLGTKRPPGGIIVRLSGLSPEILTF